MIVHKKVLKQNFITCNDRIEMKSMRLAVLICLSSAWYIKSVRFLFYFINEKKKLQTSKQKLTGWLSKVSQSQTGGKASKSSSTMDTVTLGVLVAVLVVILAALMYAKQVS